MDETPHNADYRPQASEISATLGHEPETTSIRAIAIFFVALVIALIVTGAAMVMMFDVFESDAQRADPPPSPFRTVRPLPPEPRLQIDHARDMQLLREHQERLLSEFGWVDRDAGIIRLPIEHAMRLYAERASQRQQQDQQPPDSDQTELQPAEQSSPQGGEQ